MTCSPCHGLASSDISPLLSVATMSFLCASLLLFLLFGVPFILFIFRFIYLFVEIIKLPSCLRPLPFLHSSLILGPATARCRLYLVPPPPFFTISRSELYLSPFTYPNFSLYLFLSLFFSFSLSISYFLSSLFLVFFPIPFLTPFPIFPFFLFSFSFISSFSRPYLLPLRLGFTTFLS